MGERNDMPSWGGYVHSSLEPNCSCCSYTPNINNNPDCPYETDKFGYVIGNNFQSAIEDLSNNVREQYKDISINTEYNYPTVKNDPISWDSYFMNAAILTSRRSSDINTKVGSVLVSPSNKIIGTGYNGIPKGLDKSKFPTNRNKDLHESKYGYVVHAEANALLNTTVFDLTDSKLYCTLFPCNECTKLCIQKGISEIIYLSDKHHDDPSYIASRRLLDAANIKYRQYDGDILL